MKKNQTVIAPDRRPSPHRTICLLLAVLLLLRLMPMPASAKASAVEVDGEADRFGTYQGYSTYSSGETFTDSFYYRDDWFQAEPTKANIALALLSMQLTAAAVDGTEDGCGATLLQKLDFTEQGFVGFGTEDPEDCAYTWGKKALGDCTLVVIAVQSAALDADTKEKGWTQNFLVNGDMAEGEHFGLARAAEKAIDGIASLGGDGKVKYWITGHSRGGALANLIAAKLPAALTEHGADNEGVYAYTFEAPAVTSPALAAKADYSYIHNYICSDDPVPMIPVWGMVRYGVDHELKTEQTDAGIRAELVRLGSAAAELDVPDSAERAAELVAALEQQISSGSEGAPARADYSRVRTDTFTDAEGAETTRSYSYQAVFARLMSMIFGGELAGLSLGALTNDEEKLHTAVLGLAEAVICEAAQGGDAAASRYDAAAKAVLALVNAAAENGISLNQTEAYALLRLLGPLLIDVDYEPTGDEGTDTYGYIGPLMGLGMQLDGLTYSHHFDTVLARLKVLAPQPALRGVAFTPEAPQPGDTAEKLPGEILAQLETADTPWLTITDAEWDVEDVLQDNAVAYLTVRLAAVGHSIPEDLTFTINGITPVEGPTIAYADGVSEISAVWEFTFGTPETVTISFETGNSAKAPAPIRIPKGKLLKYLARPTMPEQFVEDGSTWLFRDWEDENGVLWDELRSDGDKTLSALWTLLLDDIQLQFDIPAIGRTIAAPGLPGNAMYEITEYYVTDKKTYDTVDIVGGPGEYELSVCLTAIPDKSVFACELDEYGDPYYAGKLTVNGEEATVYYNCDPEDGGAPYLSVYYTFFAWNAPFTDVTQDAYYYKPVQWASIYEITRGTSATTFSPEKTCTRAEAVTFLWRASGSEEPSVTECPFTDVKAGSFYEKAVLWAVEQGITKGTSATTFSPDKTCSRAEIVTFLWRSEDQPEPTSASNPFTDLKPNGFYVNAVAWAVENGITKGMTDTTFEPETTCTRGQIVTFLYRDKSW